MVFRIKYHLTEIRTMKHNECFRCGGSQHGIVENVNVCLDCGAEWYPISKLCPDCNCGVDDCLCIPCECETECMERIAEPIGQS